MIFHSIINWHGIAWVIIIYCHHSYHQNARCDLWDYMSGVEVSGTGVLLEHQWKGGVDIAIIINIINLIIFAISNINSIIIITSIWCFKNVPRRSMDHLYCHLHYHHHQNHHHNHHLQKVPRQHVDHQGANGQNLTCDTFYCNNCISKYIEMMAFDDHLFYSKYKCEYRIKCTDFCQIRM